MPTTKQLLSKVPEVTIFFWIIKILATTVGETAADSLNAGLHLGLTGTSVVMGLLLAAMLIVQLRADRYIPWVYWLAVILISIVGTLITDNLVDNFGVPLQTTTIIFACALAVTFACWYAVEKTLSIHSIYTRRREGFYWLAILFTFALGTAAGDLIAEKFGLGYLVSALLVAGLIAVITGLHYGAKLNAVLAFWLAYILTRPLGAALGDYLSQDRGVGGLQLGATLTTVVFAVIIVAVVGYLTITRTDQIPATPAPQRAAAPSAGSRLLADDHR